MSAAEPLIGEKILVTGPAGQIAFPLAERLARDNEVWGIARFGHPDARERVGKAGIRTRTVDLVAPEWGDLPSDFTILLHLAAAIHPKLDDDQAMRVNAEGTGRLMSRFRNVRACLVMSTRSVYDSPEDPHHAIVESDPLGGDEPTPFSPTYRVSKLGQEAVARFAAEEFGLPTTIARMAQAYGNNGGLPAMLLDALLAGRPIPVTARGPAIFSPIHEDDIFDHLPGLVAAASVPATITNWAGDEPVDKRELCQYMGRLVGREVVFVESDDASLSSPADPTRRRALAGPCRVSWRDGIRRMIEARHTELSPTDDAE